jgi:hypothetical protein
MTRKYQANANYIGGQFQDGLIGKKGKVGISLFNVWKVYFTFKVVK